MKKLMKLFKEHCTEHELEQHRTHLMIPLNDALKLAKMMLECVWPLHPVEGYIITIVNVHIQQECDKLRQIFPIMNN